MSKKIFGIKLSAVLTFLGCILCAVFVWLIVKYVGGLATEVAALPGQTLETVL